MSTTKAFRGFIPVRKKGSNYNSEGVSETELAARVVKRAELPDEKDSDAFPIVEVWLNTHRDRYVTATASTA
jgi:hypothetical protein